MAVVSPNPHEQHNQTILRELEEGDLIQFPRGRYSHWALYMGGEEVVHLAGDENDGINRNVNSGHLFTICGHSFKKALVKCDKFWNVVLDSKAVKNNGKDKKLTPLDRNEIVKRARSKLGVIGYNVLWNNCEHFVSWCRYGKAWSEQADTVIAMIAVGFLVGAILGFRALNRSKGNDKGNDKQQTS